MHIAIGADHAGFEVKEAVRSRLIELGHHVTDMGTHTSESVDYPDYALKVAEAVASGVADRGVLICGTGIGMTITANKVPGIRAALCTNAFTTEMSRRHNDANVFCAGARVLPADTITSLVELFLGTLFDAGRHERRLQKIREVESRGRH